MAGRDRAFAEFVDTRGPVLWRMASLLELHARDAERALTDALAVTYRRWTAATRDGGPEHETREGLSASFLAHHRRDGTLDTVEPIDADLSRERSALARLTPRQRLILVLTVFSGVPRDQVAELFGASPHQFAWARGDAERAFRAGLREPPSGGLLALLDAAALADVPTTLAADAQATKAPERRRLVVAALAVSAAAAVLVSVAPWDRGDDATGAESAVNEWNIPREFDVSGHLPTLTDDPIEQASTAFLARGLPVVTDVDTGETRSVFGTNGVPEWVTGTLSSDRVLNGARWSQAVLSPDGEWLLLAQTVPDTAGSWIPATRASVGALYLVNIPTGVPTRVADMQPSPNAVGVAGIARTRLAWAPDSKGFACACTGRLSVARLGNASFPLSVNRTKVRADAVAWGPSGLAVSDPDQGWVFLNLPLSVDGSFTRADAFAISNSDPVTYLTVSALTIYALGADQRPDGGQCALWDETFTTPKAVAPMSEREGLLCTPVTVQPAGDGFLMVMEPASERPRPAPLDILAVEPDGTTSLAGAFPRGTTTGSFAADLVG